MEKGAKVGKVCLLFRLCHNLFEGMCVKWTLGRYVIVKATGVTYV